MYMRDPNLVIIVSSADLASNSTEFLWLSTVSLYVCWPDDITQMLEEMLRHFKWQTVLLWVLTNCLCNTRISLTNGKITKIKCVFTKPSSFFGIFKYFFSSNGLLSAHDDIWIFLKHANTLIRIWNINVACNSAVMQSCKLGSIL